MGKLIAVDEATGDNNYLYPIIKGEDLYCVPTCLKMLFAASGYDIDLNVLKKLFTVISPQKAKSMLEVGIHIKHDTFSKIFAKLNIPLMDTYLPVTHIDKDFLVDIIEQELQQKKHIMCGYSFGALFGDDNKCDLGHVSLILGVENSMIKILNPGPKYYGINRVNDIELYRAMSKKNSGLWIFGRTDNV